MKLKYLAYAALIAAAGLAFAIGSATNGEAKAKKKAAAPQAEPMWCFQEPKPVCGVLRGHKFTYANACSANKDGATIASSKACSVKKAHKAKKAKKAKKAMKKPAKKAAKKKM
jgi:hypothetical protein